MAVPERTTHQLVSKDGNPPKAVMTSNLWVSRSGVFSKPTFGNQIKPLTTGAAYFNDLIATLDGAAADAEVLIAGWQVNWDALLAPGVRLYDVIYRNAKRGQRFFIMPWDDTNPIQTYETQTKVALESINARLKEEGVKSGGAVSVIVAKSQSDRNSAYFSHHQKQVVIGRMIAYVGGIDLAYGRFDDATFDLNPKAQGRKFLNCHNPGLPPMKTLTKAGMADPDLMTGAGDKFDVPYIGGPSTAAQERKKIEAGSYQTRYEENSAVYNFNNPGLEGNKADLRTLREDQPRMPWQDVHSRIEGPSVMDLTRNFVRRWNALAPSSKRLAVPVISKPTPPEKNSACIQVLRSAPLALQAAEAKAEKTKTAPASVEDDIHMAMKRLIIKADHFVYIESQFFVSGFGEMSHKLNAPLAPAGQFIKEGAHGISDLTLEGVRRWDDEGEDLDRMPQNGVCAALIERITRAILDAKRPNFHVYITLPVHPEGSLLAGAVAVQVYFTMQSLVFGSNSLLNGIKRALKARELRDAGNDNWQRALHNSSKQHESIDTQDCFQYVTLLNLRNWAELPNGSVVTEQVYVHTKLMIVDDLYALLGSANVNDRSLLGMRDSEIAVLVQDGKTARADINGQGSQRPVRLFAHDLRKQIWSKLFGLTGNVRPATELKQAIEQPGNPNSWKLIQRRAKANAELYEAAFPFVPRNTVRVGKNVLNASILPTWRDDASKADGGYLTSDLPYQERFWAKKAAISPEALKGLQGIKGYITALPIKWTENENLRIPYPTSLIVHNKPKGQQDSNTPALAQTVPPLTTPATVG